MDPATMMAPHNLEAEQAVLGGVLLNDTIMPKLVLDERLSPQHFYREQHALIFQAMVELYDADRPVDVLTLTERLVQLGQLERVGGAAMVDALSGAAPAAGNAPEYARIVTRRAVARSRLTAGHEIVAAALTLDDERFDLAEAMLARSDRPSSDTFRAAQLAAEAREFLASTGDDPNAIKLPWPTLTRALAGGIRKGDTTLVSGYTHMGKTCVIDGILEHAAFAGAQTHVYSNEMSKRDWTLRMIASLTGVPFFNLMERRLTEAQRHDVRGALELLERLPISFTECTGWTGQEIGRHIRRYRWDVAAVDILNRIPHEGTKGMDEISLALNNAARQADTALLIACHLNQGRNTGERPPPPTLRDIRESGSLANDANNVMFVHRDTVEMQSLGVGTGRFVLSTEGRIYMGKARNGTLGGRDVKFDRDRMRFRELQVPT